ncbi:MAG: sigma 54-interacting transcriptional regulator [Actinomycetota bacterium]
MVIELQDRDRDPCAALDVTRAGHGRAGRGPARRQLCAAVREHAGHRLPLLVAGEAGTGKLAVARAVHECAAPAERFKVIDVALCGGGRRAVVALDAGPARLPGRDPDRVPRRAARPPSPPRPVQPARHPNRPAGAPGDRHPDVDGERSRDAAAVLAGRFVARIDVAPCGTGRSLRPSPPSAARTGPEQSPRKTVIRPANIQGGQRSEATGMAVDVDDEAAVASGTQSDVGGGPAVPGRSGGQDRRERPGVTPSQQRWPCRSPPCHQSHCLTVTYRP